MHKRPLFILIALLAMLCVAVYIRLGGPTAKPFSEKRDPKTLPESPSTLTSRARHAESVNPRTGPRANDPNKPSKPADTPEPKTYHSTVEAILLPDETLVMGGYRTDDGRHEFTMLTPHTVMLEGKGVSIELHSKIMSINPQFARDSGMDSLTTLSNRNDWAEAWTAEDVRRTLLAASETESIKIMSAPKILVSPNKTGTIEFSSSNSSYQQEVTAALTPEGKFSIHSNTERSVRAEP